MKNALLNAAMYISVPFGVRVHALKLQDRLKMKQPALIEAIKPYIAPAVDMYEIGEGVAMGDAVQPYAGFGLFGEWYGNFCYENSRLPTDAEALENLSNCIFQCFTGQLTSEQDNILRSRLNAEVAEYAHE